MTQTYFDPSSLTTMSNDELIEKYQKLELQSGKLKVSVVSDEIYNDIISILGYYEAEIDQRINDGKMQEDELDDIL